jgi:biotin operon repressor
VGDVLSELARIRGIRESNEADEHRAVAKARRLGLSWQSIAEALGRSRSSVWEKYPELH